MKIRILLEARKRKILSEEEESICRKPTDSSEIVRLDNIDFFEQNWRSFGSNRIADVLTSNILVKQLVEKISALSTVRIKKLLGKGVYGTTFLLCDDRVLKVYRGGTGDFSREEEFYSSQKEKAFSGKGSRSNLMVYDHGNLELTYPGTEPIVVGYAIISKVYPLETSISYKNDFDRILRGLRLYVFRKKPNYFQPDENVHTTFLDGKGNEILVSLPEREKFIEQMSKFIATEKEEFASFATEMVEQLVEDIEQFIKENSIQEIGDLHSGNIGIESTSPLDKPRFVIFDI